MFAKLKTTTKLNIFSLFIMKAKYFYKNYHNFFITNRKKFEEDMLTLGKKSQYFSEHSQNDFSFFYMINFIRTSNNVELLKCRDILNGIYFGNYNIGTEFIIYQESYPINILLKITLTEKNHKNIFLPIRNKEFLNIFLLSSQKFFIKSNVMLSEPIFMIYSNIKMNQQYQLLSSRYFIQKLERSNYLIYSEQFCSSDFFKNTIFTNEQSDYFFYFDVDEHYGKKILKYYRHYKFKKECFRILKDEINMCDDVSKEIIKFL